MLSLRDVHVHLGKLHILQGVNLEVKAGESAALLGRNGVGKTTTLRAIMGLVSKTDGTIQFNGLDLSNYPAHAISGKGIGYVPQGRGIFPGLSVLENLNIGVKGRRDRDREDYVFACFPRLKERLQQPGNTLSGGEQQMLAIGRALMSRPRLLMLDEPSLGLAPLIARQIFDAIRTLNRQDGLTVLIVEQNANHALKLAHRGYVMVNGLITLAGTGSELLQRPEIRSAYLEGGRHA